MKKKVCIIGCGNIANVHAQVLTSLENVQLTACCDIIPEKAKAFAEKYGCRAYTNAEEMLDQEQPFAAHLCTPHYLHTPQARMCAARGIQVLTEKPPVISRDQLRHLREAAEQVRVGVCFQNRYNPVIRKLQQLLEEKIYGALTGLRAFMTWQRNEDYYHGTWRGSFVTEGGSALINQAVHSLDLLVLLLGCPEVTEAMMANHHLRNVIGTEDTVSVYLRRGNVNALLFASTAHSANSPVIIEAQTEQAVLRVEEDRLEIIRGSEREVLVFPEDEKLGKSYWGAGHSMCISDFYRCLDEGLPFRNDLAHCSDTLETLLTIYDECRGKIRYSDRK